MSLFFKEAKVLNHAKNPSSHLKDFVPDTEGMTRYFRMRDLDAIKALGDFGSRKITF